MKKQLEKYELKNTIGGYGATCLMNGQIETYRKLANRNNLTGIEEVRLHVLEKRLRKQGIDIGYITRDDVILK